MDILFLFLFTFIGFAIVGSLIKIQEELSNINKTLGDKNE